ncbi:MOSC domain-containing protein [Cryobacterium sp. TMT1-2-2]|uniref:MOSC domain-containing protein n=1 Tax=Cryobacterium sp. TMT1-2-2 TaxID=1259233 RepID=UPI00106C5D0F|nr:MOSC N-terminal beta barrel domain-containing protein [Cryobacterium sp. TMT1-2-2]TFD11410.1 MOSC domain-containing protein [Cryobacterium sp. TMT1-2-2]
MHIRDIGVSTLKSCRHQPRDGIRLTADGPVGDRDFAVVDLNNGQILRTVENPALVACEADWVDGVLSATIDGHRVAAVPMPSGGTVDFDYWGRQTPMQVLDGPWASEFSRLLGRSVVLARSLVTGGAVYADSVTIVTTSSLDRLARESGIEVDTRRFRSTFTLDSGDTPAHLEDEWAGRELQVGGVRLLVKGGIPRCAVIDIDPDTGERGTNLLKTLGGYRLHGSDIMFGVYAEVISPGFVSVGDDVALV